MRRVNGKFSVILKARSVFLWTVPPGSRSKSKIKSPVPTEQRMATKSADSSGEKKSPLLLWKVTNFLYEEKPHPQIKLRCPGLHHESFDRDMKPKLTSIMITSAVARAAALRSPIHVTTQSSDDGNTNGTSQAGETFLDFRKLTSDYYTFMSSTEFVMSRKLYDNEISKWPLDMKFTQGFVGNSSIANVCQFFDCDDEDIANASESGQAPLWTNTYQIVLVDKTTRKPTQLPDWFKDKFKGKGCMDKGFILKPFIRPAVTFSQSSTVQWTDTDQYNHTNFTTYARWALDTLHAALRIRADTQQKSSDAPNSTDEEHSGPSVASLALPSISKESLACGLHKMQVTYLKECLEGERVETHVWQEDGGEKELVLFSVVKNGDDVCQMKMWYFPCDEESIAEVPLLT